MNLRITILFFLTVLVVSSQEKKSKGDAYFFEYAYKTAIEEYQKELHKKTLTPQQYLNLADAYFKTGNYVKASKIYLEVEKKDTIMSNHDFNIMLQSLSKTSGTDRVKAFLATKKADMSNELLENANFNFELLESNSNSELDYHIFNIEDNSPQADFSPTFYGEKLLFTSGRNLKSKEIYQPSGESYLDIYISRINGNGDILNSNTFTGIQSSKYHRATPYYSEELGKIFFVLSNTQQGKLLFDKNGKNSLAIGMADVREQVPFRFLLKDVSTSFYYPFYEASTGKLYFAANFDDSYGGTDIYYVYTNKGQIMSAPINAGPRINSPGNEIAPYIFEGSLYFSSDVFYGMGGMDIYKSNLRPDNTFSIPVNLGKGINSTEDDFGFIIRKDSDNGYMGYFSSNREGGKGNDDIYGYTVNELPGLKTFAIKGSIVKSNSNQGVAKAYVRIKDTNGKLLKEVYTNDDGKFQLEIPWQDHVDLEIGKERYATYAKDLDTAAMDEIQKKPLDIDLTRMDDLVTEKENQTVLKLNKFYFERNKATVTPEIAVELDKVVEAISKFPQFQLRIESYTDSRGASSTNLTLSQKRSDAIKAYLIKNGVPKDNIQSSMGYGEEKILNSCKNGIYCIDLLHKQNERSLIVVLNYNKVP